VAGWHDFYVTAGAASATLVGLLFVGLSLHIRVVVAHPDVRSLARVTLVDFFSVLMIALLLLAPESNARVTAAWLLAIAVISLGLSLRPGIEGFRSRRERKLGLRILVARFGLSAVGYFGIAVAGLFLTRDQEALSLSLLLAVVILLLVVAVRNTWDLLVTVADQPRG